MNSRVTSPEKTAKVGLIMGSKSDWSTMVEATAILKRLSISFEARVVSAHRTPKLLFEYAESASERELSVIIAGAGGAAHLPGMVAAITPLPVIGVPIESRVLKGVDSLLSIVQMPAGVPVATMSIGVSGAKNAALFAASLLGVTDRAVRDALIQYRKEQTEMVLSQGLPEGESS